jgi:hypothetical protein
MNNKQARQIAHNILLIIGLGMMIGGIIAGKYGAVIIGLIVSAVNVQQWMLWNKKIK